MVWTSFTIFTLLAAGNDWIVRVAHPPIADRKINSLQNSAHNVWSLTTKKLPHLDESVRMSPAQPGLRGMEYCV